MVVIFKERRSAEKPVFIDTLRSCDNRGKGRKVTELGLESCNEWEPRRIVKDGVEDL